MANWLKQNIKCKKYKNILELYSTQADFKEAIDNDKANPSQGRLFKDYMDDYSDRSDIVDGVLADCLDTINYNYKLSRHQHYHDISITITRKKIK